MIQKFKKKSQRLLYKLKAKEFDKQNIKKYILIYFNVNPN